MIMDIETHIKVRSDYQHNYYQQHKNRIIQGILSRRRLIQNSEPYILEHREVIINQLNDGTRKWTTDRSKLKFKIVQDVKTLKYS